MRLLLVEDDKLLGESLQLGLTADGYTVDLLQDGQAAYQALLGESFDMLILDLGLPKISGLTLLQQIRHKGLIIPVLILTARDSIEDRVTGLDYGADDYITKPFDLDELLARIRAVQRRHSSRADPLVCYQDITLDPAAHVVKKAGIVINIPRREFALLQKLLENTGRVLSRDYLTQSLYGWGDDIDSNALEVHIHSLRKKFGTNLIRTIRGVGYLIEKDSSRKIDDKNT